MEEEREGEGVKGERVWRGEGWESKEGGGGEEERGGERKEREEEREEGEEVAKVRGRWEMKRR